MDYTLKRLEFYNKGLIPEIFSDSVSRQILIHTERFTKFGKSYSPLLYERWLKDSIELMDRILAYRREARDLDILAFKAAMDHEKSLSLIDIERDIQISQTLSAARARAHITQSEAADRFAEDHQSGFATLASGRAAELQIEIAEVEKQISLFVERATELRNYENIYWQRHKESGNAHNFEQRAKLIYNLIGEDMSELRAKLQACIFGLKDIRLFDYTSLPKMGDLAVDEHLFWIRNLVRNIELISQDDAEFDFDIPLSQPLFSDGPLVSREALDNAWKQAQQKPYEPVRISFSLTPDMAFGFRDPRVRAIGLSFGAAPNIQISGVDPNATADSYTRMRAIIYPPKQRDEVDVRQIPIGSVRAFSANAPSLVSGDGFLNISLNGEWSIDIWPTATSVDNIQLNIGVGNPHPLGLRPPLDLKLHFRLRSVKAATEASL